MTITTTVPSRSHVPRGVDIELSRAAAGEWDGTFLLAVIALVEDLLSDDAPTRVQVTTDDGRSPVRVYAGHVRDIDGTDLVLVDGRRVDIEIVVSVAVLG